MTTPTDQLPVRLGKGDPAPEDCVAVPLYGPTGSRMTGHSWRTVSHHLPDAWGEMVEAFEAIADAAKAPLPLRRGDLVRIGDVEAVFVEHRPMSSEFCWVDYTGSSSGTTHRVPLSALTRLNDENESSANPLASTTREDGASGDAALCDEGHIEGAGGSQDPGPTPNWAGKSGIIGGVAHEAGKYSPVVEAHYKAASEVVQALKRPDWTPYNGQLVERISDGVCFRLRFGAGDWPWFLTSPVSCGSSRHPDSHNTPGICSQFRPRYLRVEDVISEAQYEQGGRIIGSKGSVITGWDDDGWAKIDGDRDLYHPTIIVHIEGLGPVPWPPTAKDTDR